MSRLQCLCILVLQGLALAQETSTTTCPNGTPEVDVLIVGAGPAGLQWGTTLEHKGFTNYVILEKGSSAGTFFRSYPRSRRLISNNKCQVGFDKSRDFALRHDWNSLLDTNISYCDVTPEFYGSADDLVTYFEKVAMNLRIEYNADVAAVQQLDGKHLVQVADGRRWICKHLVVASGFNPEPLPKYKWAEKEAYTYADFPPLDKSGRAEFCKNREVFVIGNGNAAFETANMLAGCAGALHMWFRRPPRFSALTHYVGDVRMKSFEIADRYLLKSLDTLQIYGNATGREKEEADLILTHQMQFNATIVFCGGFTGERDSLVTSMNKSARFKFPLTGSFYSDQKVKNKWYAGNLMHGRDYRRSAAGFIHGFRYLIQAQINYMLAKYYERPYPSMKFKDAKSLTAHVGARFQNSSALYQMHGVLRDIVLRQEADNSYLYIEQVPREFPDEVFSLFGLVRPSCWCEVGFDYGHTEDTPGEWPFNLIFKGERVGQHPPLFLHPVVVAVDSAGAQQHFHGAEDVRAVWEDAESIQRNHEVVESCLDHCFAEEDDNLIQFASMAAR